VISRLLIDTNVVIWLLSESGRISRRAKQALSGSGVTVLVSVVTAWEVVLKHRAGKLELLQGIEEVLSEILYRSPWTILPVVSEHVRVLAALPALHNDPFDRLLIAQALYENLTIVTADQAIAKYAVRTLW
jgi:PIN domain nuclease of toxin-antitoxin system